MTLGASIELLTPAGAIVCLAALVPLAAASVGAARARSSRLLSKKKSFVATERDTPEHRKRRREYCALITALNPHRFVFIDESFCKTNMRREYGWSRRGQRLTSSRPFGRWKTLSLIGAIRLGERPRLMTHRGAVNGRVFLRFVKQRLVPSLRRGDIVVMDNLNIHKTSAVRQARCWPPSTAII